jgi:hypothetical protein
LLSHGLQYAFLSKRFPLFLLNSLSSLYFLHAGQRFRPWQSNSRIGPLAMCPSLIELLFQVFYNKKAQQS